MLNSQDHGIVAANCQVSAGIDFCKNNGWRVTCGDGLVIIMYNIVIHDTLAATY